MSLTGSRAPRGLQSASGSKTYSTTAQRIEIGVLVLVAHGEALKNGSIWSYFNSIFCGSCRIVAASHPRYEQV